MDNSNVAERDRLLIDWQNKAAVLDAAKLAEMEARKAVMAYCFPEAKRGTNTLELGNGYALKAVRKINYKLEKDISKVNAVYDVIAKLGNEGATLAASILKRTYDFGESAYNKLDLSLEVHKSVKAYVDTILTTNDGAPSLEIKAPKGK